MTADAVVTENLTIAFGGLTAVDGVDLQIPAGQRRAIIGPNGAGKTTLFNLIAGQLRPTAGRVLVGGEDITGQSVHARSRAGIARTFQLSNLFGQLTVADNVRLAIAGGDPSVRRTFWRPLAGFAHVERRVADLLARWELDDVADERPSELSYGQQRILELVLATSGDPRVLLLDEPTAGVSKSEAERLADTIAALPRDLTIVLVEHDMDIAFRLADEVTVMVNGQELVTGSPDVVASDERVIDAYLGSDHDVA
ncbi:ABC transporter ATP-binding protein [Nitriliruptor alkaliphilus]|uniref:ABC transporter ATP-binding protein n=1 Tax=Nitriliruptor alkaliphilus TaxID=427918 RepID=UPI00069884CD|nr:ABC transporter ATP-binding protein [Nitriliruptor alkaliphilus]